MARVLHYIELWGVSVRLHVSPSRAAMVQRILLICKIRCTIACTITYYVIVQTRIVYGGSGGVEMYFIEIWDVSLVIVFVRVPVQVLIWR